MPAPLPLSDAQKVALDANPDAPLPVVDDRTDTPYVIISAAWLERLKEMIPDDGDHDLSEWYPAVFASFGRAGWDDPVMDEYNDYDENLRKLRGESR